MKNIYLLLISLALFYCWNERILQLPELENATITEISDVSHAYLFYDETKEDSIELNRKNLIITTNWLVNVDKRLTLGQAIPKIKFLQEKKRNAELHKNEDAKNYFTCNDTSINNLGFLEFTDVIYKENNLQLDLNFNEVPYEIFVVNINKIQIISPNNKDKFTTIENMKVDLRNEMKKTELHCVMMLSVPKTLSFQNYITIKSELSKLESERTSLNKNEFIY